MVSGGRCSNCDAAPRMEYAGMAPRPNKQPAVVVECPACGTRETIEQDDESDGGGLW